MKLFIPLEQKEQTTYNCCITLLSQIESQIKRATNVFCLQESSCLEILHEQTAQQNIPIVVHCQSNKDRAALDPYNTRVATLPRLLDVTRCCSNNTVFNVYTGSCELTYDISGNSNSHVDDFLSLLPKELETWDFLNVHKGMAKCSGAIFTYEINAEDVTFVDGALKVSIYLNSSTQRSVRNISFFSFFLR